MNMSLLESIYDNEWFRLEKNLRYLSLCVLSLSPFLLPPPFSLYTTLSNRYILGKTLVVLHIQEVMHCQNPFIWHNFHFIYWEFRTYPTASISPPISSVALGLQSLLGTEGDQPYYVRLETFCESFACKTLHKYWCLEGCCVDELLFSAGFLPS